MESRRWRQPSLARHCSLPARRAASGSRFGLKAARDGANVAIAAKTAEPNPKLPGTIYSAAEEIEKTGGKALSLTVDVRDEAQVRTALEKTAASFGGLDIVVNNASAISLTDSAGD